MVKAGFERLMVAFTHAREPAFKTLLEARQESKDATRFLFTGSVRFVLMTAEQKLNYGKLALALLGSPGKIPAILRLQRQMQLAAKNLAQVLTRVIPGSDS